MHKLPSKTTWAHGLHCLYTYTYFIVQEYFADQLIILAAMRGLEILLGTITAIIASGKRSYVVVRKSDHGLPSLYLTGVAAVTVRIRAYNATGELDTIRGPFTLGTRVLLTCELIVHPEGAEVDDRYRWFHSLTGASQDRYQIRDRDPYYRVLKDALLIDVTSLDQGGKYTCFVMFNNVPPSSDSTAIITVDG